MSTLYQYSDRDFQLSHGLDTHPNTDDFPMHAHSTAEVYYFISGKGIFHIEGSAYPLESGDLMVMYPSESHYIEIDRNYPYERKLLNFRTDFFKSIDSENLLSKAIWDRKSGKRNQYKSYEFKGGSCEHYWQTMMAREGDPRINLLSGLVPLLGELYHIHTGRSADIESASDTLEYRIIRYVNKNISRPVTLDEICQRYFISKSQLCRLFKKSTGTTVWQYITIKRLVTARQLLQSGENPTRVYAQCGFNDYSTFYRAYVKYFNRSPREEN